MNAVIAVTGRIGFTAALRFRIVVRVLPRRVGIGDAQRRQYVAFSGFHGFGFVLDLVIITQKMQHAVNGKMTKMIGDALALFPGFPADHAMRQDEIAQQCRRRLRIAEVAIAWKGQNIGRPVDTAILIVQRPRFGIVAEPHAQFGHTPGFRYTVAEGRARCPFNQGLHVS